MNEHRNTYVEEVENAWWR